MVTDRLGVRIHPPYHHLGPAKLMLGINLGYLVYSQTHALRTSGAELRTPHLKQYLVGLGGYCLTEAFLVWPKPSWFVSYFRLLLLFHVHALFSVLFFTSSINIIVVDVVVEAYGHGMCVCMPTTYK